MKRFFLFAIAMAAGFAWLPEVSAQTIPHVTGTFKTPANQTPAQAGLKAVATIGATAVYGAVEFQPYDSAGNKPMRILCGGVTYIPQRVRAWIKGDGTLVDNATAAAGVDLVPTAGCNPTGLVMRAFMTLAGTADGRIPSVTWTEDKSVPQQASADWGALSVAAISSPAFSYQQQSQGNVLDYEDWTNVAAPANPAAGKARTWFDSTALLWKCKKSDGTDCNPAGSGSGITSLNLLTGATQTFAKTDDTNVTMGITSAGSVHTFALGWSGTLAKARQHSQSVYADQSNIYAGGAQDFGLALSLKAPSSAGAAPTASGLLGYDLTTNKWVFGQNGVAVSFGLSSPACAANQWVNVAATGTAAASCAQPGFSNLSGSLGIGQTPLTTRGDLLSVNNVPALVRIALGTNGQCLTSNGLDALWGACAAGSGVTLQTNSVNNTSQTTLNLLNSAAWNGLTLSHTNTSLGNVQLGLSGILTVPGGGWGLGTLSLHQLYVGNGTAAPNSVAPGATGQVLISNGASADPTFADPIVSPNQDTASTGAWTSATALNTAVSVAVSQRSTVTVSFNGSSITAGAVTFEASPDNTTWYAKAGVRGDASGFESAYTLTGANQSWTFAVGGYTNFRVRLSTVITGAGTANINVIPQALGSPNLQAVLANLRNAAGTEIGTAANPIRTDPTGTTTQPVSGTFWQATQPISAASLPLPTGAATEATLSALNTKIPASPATDRTTAGAPSAARLTDGTSFYKGTTPADTQPVNGTVTGNQGTAAATTAPWFMAHGTVVATTASWTSATAQNTSITIATLGYQTCVLTFSGTSTMTGGVLTFEASDDSGTTWWPLPMSRTDSYSTDNTYTLSVTTQAWDANCGGFTNFRARLSTVISGTGTASLRLQASAAATEPDVIVGQSVPANLQATVVGSLANNGAAAATNRVGTLPGIARTDYAGGTALTPGRDAAPDVGTDGLLHVAALPALRPSSFAASAVVSSVASATDIAVISGNATNTLLVTRVKVSCTQTTAGIITLNIIKRSTADSAGTSASMTIVPDDASGATISSTALTYTANPTTGTAVGNVDTYKIGCLAAGTATPNDIYILNRTQKPIVLRGTAQQLAVNLGGVTVTGGSFAITYEGMEVTTITP